MAEIPIERRSGSSWLVWAVLLVLAALLAWWLLGRGDESRVAGGDVMADSVATAPAAAAPATEPAAEDESAAVVSDLAQLTGAADAAALVGRRVALSSVNVQDVVSDRGFWVGSGEDDRVFAVRMEQVTPPDGAVNPGQTVSLQGVLRAMPSNLEEQRTPWNLGSTDVSVLAAQSVYIEVDSVAILQRP
ncbi:MAG TPA: hypothetical protein VGE02_06975 [Gemmatimonadales bacterium]